MDGGLLPRKPYTGSFFSFPLARISMLITCFVPPDMDIRNHALPTAAPLRIRSPL
jgi:hypothetical protein